MAGSNRLHQRTKLNMKREKLHNQIQNSHQSCIDEYKYHLNCLNTISKNIFPLESQHACIEINSFD